MSHFFSKLYQTSTTLADWRQLEWPVRGVNLCQHLAIFLISFGCTLFYAGHKNYVFNERFYEHQSLGVVKPNEPIEIFNNWRTFIVDRTKIDEKRRGMLSRRVELSRLIPVYKGEFFEAVDDGKRLYLYKSAYRSFVHAGNNGLEFIGILAALFGLVLAVFEPKLTRQSYKSCMLTNTQLLS